jgi:hypothetical protein
MYSLASTTSMIEWILWRASLRSATDDAHRGEQSLHPVPHFARDDLA